MSEHLDDAWKSAVFHGIDKRITAIPFNQDEVVLLPLQGDWVQCKVAVDEEDVISVYFKWHFSVGTPLGSAPPAVPDHDLNLMGHGRVPEVSSDISEGVLFRSV